MKKSFAAVAVVLAAGLTLTAAGCGSSSKNLAILSSNWYTGTTFKDIQPEIYNGEEIIEYAVKHEQPDEKLANETYTVQYGEGTYRTEFHAATFSADNLNFPEELKADYKNAGKFAAYCYKTVLDIHTVTITMKKNPAQTVTFDKAKGDIANYVETESWFLSVNDMLRPLYSKEKTQSVTPWSLKPKKLEEGDAYKTFDLTYENFYSYDGKSVTTLFTDNLVKDAQSVESKYEKLNKTKNSLFDPFARDVVVRASDLYAGSNLSQAVSFYIPQSKKVENFTLSGYNIALGFEQSVIDQLAGAGLYEEKKPAESDKTDGEDGTDTQAENDGEENSDTKKLLNTVQVAVPYTSGSQSGGTQYYWLCAVTDKYNNTGRATLLQTAIPVPYQHGALYYTLENIVSSFNKI